MATTQRLEQVDPVTWRVVTNAFANVRRGMGAAVTYWRGGVCGRA